MADILLVGTAPKNEEGKEYFLHCTDWWWDILFVIDRLLKDDYPVDEYFVRESLLSPPAPAMNAEESLEFSTLIENILQDGSARTCLKKIYREDPNLFEYYGTDEELINNNINHRIEQIEEFSRFLRSCGGCAVKWYYPE